MDNKVRQGTSKTALDARGHKSDIGCRVRIPVLTMFVCALVRGRMIPDFPLSCLKLPGHWH